MRKFYTLLILFALSSAMFAQNRTVTGTVTDASDGSPIPGATVSQKGTSNGTITDLTGKFAIQVPENATLVVSFIGMKTAEIAIGTSTVIDVKLEPGDVSIEEVVVVGYGTQKKSVVTGAIAKVAGDDFSNIKTTRVEDAMHGRTAGVTVTTNSGQPGAGSVVRIRGIGTVNNSEPLYIVDGMPIEGGIDFVNPNDIESIEVLKDAASSAVYGARAANGVILITTKAGTASRANITYDMYMGFQNPWKKRAMLNATEYGVIINEARANAGMTPKYADPYALGEGTDWQDEVFNYNAPVTSHNITLSGGNERFQNYASLSLFGQEGIVGGEKSKYDRTTVRLNTTYKVIEEKRTFLSNLTFSSNLAYSRIQSKGVDENSEWGSVLGSALMMSPIAPVFETDAAKLATYPANAVKDANGNVFSLGYGEQEITNPLADLYIRHSQGYSDKFVANFNAKLEIVKGLSIISKFGTDLAFWGGRGWTPVHYLGTTKSAAKSSVWANSYRGMTWLLENVITYEKKIGQHNFNVLLGMAAQETTGGGVGGGSFDLQVEDDNKAYIDFATAEMKDQSAYGGAWQSRLASTFGRVNYNYAEKYLFEAVVRRDGSSNFGPNNKFGIFPSVSTGWVISNESFLKNNSLVSFMKIRAGWGQNGNEKIGAFNYTATLAGGNNYTFGSGTNEKVVNGVKPSRLTNPSIKWETSEQINIGVDARFFGSKFTVTADYFIKNTIGMLKQAQVPSLVGDGAPDANVGSMKNSGLELELGYKIKAGDLNMNIFGNISHIKNELIDLGNESGIQWENRHAVGDYISRSENGFPVGSFYGWRTDGIFQNQKEVDDYLAIVTPKGQAGNPVPGDIRFKDLNGDGLLDDNDREYIGNPHPDWIYGFNFSADWKGIDLSFNIQGVAGNEIYDATRRPELVTMNYSANVLNRWTGEGTSTTEPRVTALDNNRNGRTSDRFVYDGSFLRLRDVQLGYTLPKFKGVSRIRVYATGQNLYTITKYPGFDPEIGSGMGVDKGIYPQARTYTFGVNINF